MITGKVERVGTLRENNPHTEAKIQAEAGAEGGQAPHQFLDIKIQGEENIRENDQEVRMKAEIAVIVEEVEEGGDIQIIYIQLTFIIKPIF